MPEIPECFPFIRDLFGLVIVTKSLLNKILPVMEINGVLGDWNPVNRLDLGLFIQIGNAINHAWQ